MLQGAETPGPPISRKFTRTWAAVPSRSPQRSGHPCPGTAPSPRQSGKVCSSGLTTSPEQSAKAGGPATSPEQSAKAGGPATSPKQSAKAGGSATSPKQSAKAYSAGGLCLDKARKCAARRLHPSKAQKPTGLVDFAQAKWESVPPDRFRGAKR